MKRSAAHQSVTSLRRAPHEDAGARLTRYMVMMGIRLACFLAMALVTPYGWYTWLFAAGAVFLPYLAVVVANIGDDTGGGAPVAPDRTLESGSTHEAQPTSQTPRERVLRVEENPPRRPDA